VKEIFWGGINRKGKEQKMNVFKVLWRLGLCALFVIGLMYGSSAYATEPEAPEEAVHEMQKMTEKTEQELTKEGEQEAIEEGETSESQEQHVVEHED
jgi:hypothetical protein